MVKLSAVIPTFNARHDAVEAVRSLKAQAWGPLEIIVVDNGSSDGTPDAVAAACPDVTVLRLSSNTGVTGGRNAGFAHASGDVVLFFDHDMVADPAMAGALLAAAQSDPAAGIVTGKIYYASDRNRIWAAGTGIDLRTGRVLFRGGPDTGQYERQEDVPVAPAMMLVTRAAMEATGGFDDLFFANWEDADFCYRARAAGFKTLYTPAAVAYHHLTTDHGESMRRLLARAYYVGRNRVLFMKRHAPRFAPFAWRLPLYVAYYAGQAVRWGRIGAAWHFMRGTLAGLVLRLPAAPAHAPREAGSSGPKNEG